VNAWHVRRGFSWLARPTAVPAKVRRWIRRRRLTPRYRQALNGSQLLVEAGPLPDRFTISVVMPVFRVAEDHLRAAIASVRAQSWPDWELVVVDDASPDPHVARLVAEAASDARVRVVRRSANGGISVASNEAVAAARGEFVAFLDHDDALHPRAVELAVRFLARHRETDWLFTDEDRIDGDGAHSEPMFKPGWSRHLLLAFNLVSHLRVVRRAAIERVGGHRTGFEGAQDYDLALRILDAGGRFSHLPGPLYHWRSVPGSMARGAAAKPLANERAAAALLEHAERFPRGGTSRVEVLAASASLFRVRRAPAGDLSFVVAGHRGTAAELERRRPHPTGSAPVEVSAPADLVAAARIGVEDVLLVPPPGGFSGSSLAELLALLQVPGTAAATGRFVARGRVAESGWVVDASGDAVDPWAGAGARDPGELNLALLPGRRTLPVSVGWVAWRSSVVEAWDAAPDAPDPWRLAVGWDRLGLEVVATAGASFPARAGRPQRPSVPPPRDLAGPRTLPLAALGLLP